MTRKHALIAAALSCTIGFCAPILAQDQQVPQPPQPPEPPMAPMPPMAPVPPMAPAPSMAPMPPAAVTDANVTFTSHPGNSISPDYHVDFDAMDANHDGRIVRAEARGNADLMREFHVVDSNHDGRLTREEMKGWLD